MPFYIVRKVRPIAFTLRGSLAFRAEVARSRQVFIGSDWLGDPDAKALSIGGAEEAEFQRILREAAVADTLAPRPESVLEAARLAVQIVHLLEVKAP